jgi:hypothetical protein
LELQKEFTENDAASNIPFHNVFEGVSQAFGGLATRVVMSLASRCKQGV